MLREVVVQVKVTSTPVGFLICSSCRLNLPGRVYIIQQFGYRRAVIVPCDGEGVIRKQQYNAASQEIIATAMPILRAGPIFAFVCAVQSHGALFGHR